MLEILQVLQNMLYVAITGFGVLLVRELLNFIGEKVDEIQANKKIKDNELLNQYIDTVQQIVYDVVLTVSQTYVDSLKGSQSFDEQAQKQAKQMAITTAKSLISYEAQEAIIKVYGNMDLYISNLIESMVKQSKTN